MLSGLQYSVVIRAGGPRRGSLRNDGTLLCRCGCGLFRVELHGLDLS